MANIDFEFDFEAALSKAYHEDEIYQEIADIAKDIELGTCKTENAIRTLIKINFSILSKVLASYNYELLNNL